MCACVHCVCVCGCMCVCIRACVQRACMLVCEFTKFTGVTGFWTISCPNVCDPKHCVNCVYSEVCIVVSTIKTCVVMVTVCEKGPVVGSYCITLFARTLM